MSVALGYVDQAEYDADSSADDARGHLVAP